VKFLFSVRPFFSHFAALAPIALQLRQGHHEVRFATAVSMDPLIAPTAFPLVPAGIDPRRQPPPGLDAGASTSDFQRGGITTKVHDLVDACSTWRPDLIVREQTDLAAVVAAEVLQVLHATVALGLFTTTWTWRHTLGDELDAVRTASGLPSDPNFELFYPSLYLDRVPPSFQYAGAPPSTVTRSIRPTVLDCEDDYVVPGWLSELRPGPTICVTFGTVYNHQPDLLERIVTAFADTNVNVVCTLGPGEKATEWMTPTSNIYAEPYIPHSVLFPRCHAVICHAGFNTLMAAFSYGLPVLCLPIAADQPANADRCTELGVGLSVAPEDAWPTALQHSVLRLMSERSFRTRARHIQAEIARLPDAAYAASVLVDLAARANQP
jgi:UDP:flavonoid glycosyltransferase YjiC (YdhE family)